MFIKRSFTCTCTNISHTHSQTLSLPHTYTHIIILFTGLDFGSSHSRAAFISVCLDTIYYQLFILVFSPSLCLSLSSCLLLLDSQTVSACVCVRLWRGFSQWVCLSPSSSLSGCHFLACPQRGSQSVCLVCHFIYPSVSRVCVCVWESEWVRWFVSQAWFWPWPFTEAMWQKFTEPNSLNHSQPDTPPHCL